MRLYIFKMYCVSIQRKGAVWEHKTILCIFQSGKLAVNPFPKL